MQHIRSLHTRRKGYATLAWQLTRHYKQTKKIKRI